MNNDNKHIRNEFDFTEINKIQAEIDKDLATISHKNLEEAEKAVASEEIILENVNEEVIKEEVAHKNPEVLPHTLQSGTRIVGTEYTLGAGIYPKETNNFNNTFLNSTVKNEKSKGKFKKAIAITLVASLGFGFAGGFGLKFAESLFFNKSDDIQIEAPSYFSFSESAENTATNAIANVQPISIATLSYADLVEKVKPSVVAITKISTVQSSGFGFFSMPSQPQQVPSAGSGIIFDETDELVYIVTNFHVIERGDYLGVSIQNSEDVEATVVGTSPESDLAVLSILKQDLLEAGVESVVVAEFADSDTVRAGDFVLAVGNALGEGNSATFGMVSFVNKEIYVEDRVLTVIQTDAAINPGNSGGPLINLSGQVVGISTVKLAELSIDAIGFGITSNMAKPIIEDLRNQVKRPFLGIMGYDVDERIAQIYSLPQMGVIVENVIEGGSAHNAGIRRGDIITSFNNQTVDNFEGLVEKIQSHAVGDVVEITVIRDGREILNLKVTLLERPTVY